MRRRIAVLMGGVSGEREVSLKSGRAVASALRERRHQVVEVDLTEESIEPVRQVNPDLAFIMLHGRFGEDGAVQALLERAGIPYTGSDALASRAGMNKMASKCYFITHDVPTPPFKLLRAEDGPNRAGEAAREVGLPLVVKPIRQGSSLGVTVARRMEEVERGLSVAFQYDQHALLERYIQGREFTVGVLDGAALPVIELRYSRPFFTYEAKYSDATTEYDTRPDLAPDMYDRLQAIAVAAHNALGCRHFSRVDMMLEWDGCPYVLEVNTIPGFTERSLFPLAARTAGISFPDLCERIAEMALAEASVPQAGGARH